MTIDEIIEISTNYIPELLKNNSVIRVIESDYNYFVDNYDRGNSYEIYIYYIIDRPNKPIFKSRIGLFVVDNKEDITLIQPLVTSRENENDFPGLIEDIDIDRYVRSHIHSYEFSSRLDRIVNELTQCLK